MGVYMHLCKNVLSYTFKICVLTVCKLHQKNSKKEREREERVGGGREKKIKHFVPELENLENNSESPLVFVTNDFTDFITFFLSHHVPDYKES